MPRVMTIYGTRPEAIKMAPLVAALGDHPELEAVVAVTGQHREMLDQVNELFEITPDHDLNLMKPGATLPDIAARALVAMTEVLQKDRPDCVVVHGDTLTTFIGALAAFYEQVPVVHLEAGLRTGNMYSPFPEEANRRLTAPLTALHLAPTAMSRDNLLREGTDPQTIVVTGNTVIDALMTTTSKETTFDDPRVGQAVAKGRGGTKVILVTAHRRESWGDKMREAMQAIKDLAQANPEVLILLPMHRNPTVREVIEPMLGSEPNVILTEPMEYHQFAHAIAAANIILTDSGGVQEEAPTLGKPVLVMRDTTERPEAVDAGTVKLVGTDGDLIRSVVQELLDDQGAYDAMANAVNPYGDGVAAKRAAAAIAQMLGVGERLPDFDPANPGL